MLSIHHSPFFSQNRGRICIDTDDAVLTRADIIFFDPSSRRISALVEHAHIDIGVCPPDMVVHFMKQDHVVLTARHPHGHEVALHAPLTILQ